MRIRRNWNKAPLDSDQESDKSNKTGLDIDDENM